MASSSFNVRDREGRKQTVAVLAVDDTLVVLDKPAGLLVIPDHWDPTKPNLRDLAQQFLEREYGDGAGKIWVVHRIDKDTSGVVVFARTAAMHRELNRLFEQSRIDKTYLALVQGTPAAASGTIDEPIQRHPAKRGVMYVHPKGKAAITHYRVVEAFRHYALLELKPETGRTHQIRVHLQALGCPLLVDPVYGSREAFDLSLIKRGYRPKDPWESNPALIDRQTLHAAAVAFTDPLSGGERRFESDPPRDFRATLKALRKWDR